MMSPSFALRSCVFVVLFCLGFVLPAMANDEKQVLERGKPVEREMAGGETHEFQLQLSSNRFVLVKVLQKGIDVVVRLYAPSEYTHGTIHEKPEE